MNQVPMLASEDGELGVPFGCETPLLQQIVDEFCPRFAAGGEIWHVAHSDGQSAVGDEQALWASGIGLGLGSEMGDVVVKHATENWLLLIEAMTPDRQLDETCLVKPAVALGANPLPLVYVAAFRDRSAFGQCAVDLPWGTHVWFAAEPDHLIHFGGSKLLGPYD